MKRFIQLTIATFLMNLCAEGAATDFGKVVVQDFTQEWSRGGSLKWLETLRENPHTVFYVNDAAENWIREADLEVLMAQIGSKVPAGTVCYFASAHGIPNDFQSTVGHEAAIVVDTFRRKGRYPGNCSDLTVADPKALRQWWAQRAKPARAGAPADAAKGGHTASH